MKSRFAALLLHALPKASARNPISKNPMQQSLQLRVSQRFSLALKPNIFQDNANYICTNVFEKSANH
jgi:hypothetical protein